MREPSSGVRAARAMAFAITCASLILCQGAGLAWGTCSEAGTRAIMARTSSGVSTVSALRTGRTTRPMTRLKIQGVVRMAGRLPRPRHRGQAFNPLPSRNRLTLVSVRYEEPCRSRAGGTRRERQDLWNVRKTVAGQAWEVSVLQNLHPLRATIRGKLRKSCRTFRSPTPAYAESLTGTSLPDRP